MFSVQLRLYSLVFASFISFLLLTLSVSPTLAASITLSDGSPSTLSSVDQEYTVKVQLTIDAADGTQYFLRGVLAKEGSSNYCGKTWNGSSWFSGPYSGDGFKQLPVVTIASGSAQTQMTIRADPEDSGCRDAGTYMIKVQRYTHSGSGSFDEQNQQTVVLALPTVTPTATKTPSPVPSTAPTATSTPTRAPTTIPTRAVTLTIVPEPTEELITPMSDADKAARLIAPSPVPSPSAAVLGATDQSANNLVIWGLLGGGALSLGVSGYLGFVTHRKHARREA